MLLLLDTLQGYQELGIRWERGYSCSWTSYRNIRSLESGWRRGAPAPGHPAGISGAWDQVGDGVLLLPDTLQGYQELGIRWERSEGVLNALAPGHPPGISGARDQVGEVRGCV